VHSFDSEFQKKVWLIPQTPSAGGVDHATPAPEQQKFPIVATYFIAFARKKHGCGTDVKFVTTFVQYTISCTLTHHLSASWVL